MEKKLIASIYFGKNCTFFSLIEKQNSTFCLHYLNSLKEPIDLLNFQLITSKSSLFEMNEVIEKYRDKITFFFVTIDTEYSIITKIPNNFDLESSEFSDLLNLEIRQNFPNLSLDDFKVKIIELHSEPSMNLVIITSKEMINSIENMIFSNFGFTVTDINVSQIAAANALLFNYPDVSMNTNIIVNVNGDLLEYGIIDNKKIIGYEFNLLDENQDISAAIETKTSEIIKDFQIDELDGIYFFGQNLEKQCYLKCWEVGMLLGKDAKRLNPFRMFENVLDKRDIDYCARTFHLYAACVGGALPIQFPVTVK